MRKISAFILLMAGKCLHLKQVMDFMLLMERKSLDKKV